MWGDAPTTATVSRCRTSNASSTALALSTLRFRQGNASHLHSKITPYPTKGISTSTYSMDDLMITEC
ncbi:hypothetical protein SERLA73DRAFT_191920 [Serpula lacrymans var. lacrymans S7.3]|uniref:Uncharacterized protein n=2 Tax=Serpula lacrymans var. lacrymans TaxID=341189 RepID=F8QIL8_SERL3|nr:uncharacterized protein SERLADRAFT_465889 [Serpula lacrymans var. lacrymans S7.9]EGN91857.1 hypothetical protein SERLA73DRAFT_191920 [Serpula lacrymans var. lacrymans S7.3]EGO25558.1 hypothetical protein SERLADRAFT_465889 [Serpula lacrymans var. lacrymans S7.9]